MQHCQSEILSWASLPHYRPFPVTLWWANSRKPVAPLFTVPNGDPLITLIIPQEIAVLRSRRAWFNPAGLTVNYAARFYFSRFESIATNRRDHKRNVHFAGSGIVRNYISRCGPILLSHLCHVEWLNHGLGFFGESVARVCVCSTRV